MKKPTPASLRAGYRWAATHVPRRGFVRAAPAIAITCALGGFIAVAYYYARGLWFAGDDWDFLLHRGTVPGFDDGLWAPHYGHWSSGVVVVYRILFSVVGLDSYLPYILVCWVLHAAIVVTMYLLLRRCGTGRPVAVVVCWLLAALGAGAEVFLWDAVMNLIASLLFGLLALLVLLSAGPTPRARLAAWLLLIAGLSFSGAGVTMVVVVATAVALAHGLRAAAVVAVVPTAAYVLWWALIGHTDSPSTVKSRADYLDVPEFWWHGMSYPFGAMTGLPTVGGLFVVVLLALPAIARGVPERLRLLAWAGVLGACFQMLITATTRVSAGLSWAESGRYGYLTVALLVPSLALGGTWLVRSTTGPRWVGAIVVVVLVALYSVQSVRLMHTYVDEQEPYLSPWADRVHGLLAAIDAGEVVLTDEMDPGVNPFLRAGLVSSPAVRAALPGDPATAQERLDAESMAMVAVDDVGHSFAGPEEVRLVLGFEGPFSTDPGCHSYTAVEGGTPAMEVDIGEDGAQLVVRSPVTKIRTQLVRDGTDSLTRDWSVEPGEAVYIATTAKDTMMRVTFDQTGSYVICAG